MFDLHDFLWSLAVALLFCWAIWLFLILTGNA